MKATVKGLNTGKSIISLILLILTRGLIMAEKNDVSTAYRMMKSPNKKTARRGLKIIKQVKRVKRGIK